MDTEERKDKGMLFHHLKADATAVSGLKPYVRKEPFVNH